MRARSISTRAAGGPLRLGHHHQPRGVLVEAVDDARPARAADVGDAGRVVEQRVHQRAARHPGAGVDDEPGGLVHHQQVLVLVDDVERDGGGHEAARRGSGKLDGDLGARAPVRPRAAPARRRAGRAPSAIRRAAAVRERLELVGEKPVEALGAGNRDGEPRRRRQRHGRYALGGGAAPGDGASRAPPPSCPRPRARARARRAAGHRHVRHVEDRPVQGAHPDVDEVHHLAARHAVDQVADRAAQDQRASATRRTGRRGPCERSRTSHDDRDDRRARRCSGKPVPFRCRTRRPSCGCR